MQTDEWTEWQRTDGGMDGQTRHSSTFMFFRFLYMVPMEMLRDYKTRSFNDNEMAIHVNSCCKIC